MSGNLGKTIKFSRVLDAPAGEEIVIDNTDGAATKSGTWATTTYGSGGVFWGANYAREGPGTGANWFKWTPTIASAGRYRVYARWIQAGYSTQAKYRVVHNGGETITTVNQTMDGGRWMALGDYDLTPGSGHRVEIRDDGVDGGSVADAVRFVRLAETRTVQADAVKFTPNTAEALLYVHSDHLGAPQKLTDGTGAVVWDASFRPYGEEDAITGAADTNQRFPGQYFDIESALHYNYRRDYDPAIGRYMQSDPIGLAGGLNTYAYVGGNPVNDVDPTGEFGIVVYGGDKVGH